MKPSVSKELSKVFSEKVANSIDALLAYWDEKQICRYSNDAYRKWFGRTREDMVGKVTMKELLGPLYPKNLPYIEGALRGDVQVFERDTPTPDGTVRHSLATYTPDIEDGRVVGIITHVVDITKQKNTEMELSLAKKKAEELSTHDYLTGLPNRVLLNDRIESSILIAKRRNLLFAVSILDLDCFKKINDTFGHLAGDMVLVEIANRSQSALREYDTISRFGGDEFVILLPEIQQREEIEIVGNRLLEYSRMAISFQDKLIQPSLSLGIAVYPNDGTDRETLLKKADRALYVAKSMGKNRLSFAEDWSSLPVKS